MISKNIFSFNFSSPFTPLFSSLKSIIFIQKESLFEFSKSLHELFLEYGNSLIEKENLSLKSNLNELKKNEKELLDSLSLIGGIQAKYFIECKNAENAITEYEFNKDCLQPSDRFSLEDMMKKKIFIAKECETNYINTVANSNISIDKYFQNCSIIMKNIKNLDKSLVCAFQGCLQKFHTNSLRKNNTERIQLEEHNKILEQIPYNLMQEDKKSFQIYKPDSIEFKPYQIPILEKKDNNEGKENKEIKPKYDIRVHNMIVRMKNEFKKVGEKVII